MEPVNPEPIHNDEFIDVKGALTTITPDLVANDAAHAHQLSDDAAAHQPQDTTSDDAQVERSNEPLPQSPFANAAAPIGEEHTDSVGFINDELYADGSRQHHLLRHSLPSELRGTGVLSHFGVDTVSEASKIIKKMSQRDLQAKFKAVYGTKTFSNNNNWLRRKLFEAIGLDPSKGAVKKPGVGSQRRRRSNNTANRSSNGGIIKPLIPRAHRRTKAELDAENRSVAEALLALGELADMAGDFLDEDEEEIDEEIEALRRQRQRRQAMEEGRVPSTGADGAIPDGEARLSWSTGAAAMAAAARGVPVVDSESPRGVTSAMMQPMVLDHRFHPLHDIKEDGMMAMMSRHHHHHHKNHQNNHHISHGHQDGAAHVLDWLAKLQQQQHAAEASSTNDANDAVHAAASSSPHHLLHQLHNAHPGVAAMMANNPFAMAHMAAMSGNPHAAITIMQAIMASQDNSTGIPPEAFHKVMQDALAQLQQQQVLQQQQQNPQLSMMQHMLHGHNASNANGQVTTISPLPMAPPLFGNGDGTLMVSK